MKDLEEKIQAINRLREEQQEVKKKFMEEYLRLRNSRHYKGMATSDQELKSRLTEFNNQLKHLEQATILKCIEQSVRVKEHVAHNKKLISDYFIHVSFDFWGDDLSNINGRCFGLISSEMIAQLGPFDVMAVVKGESEMQNYTPQNQLEVPDECWLYWMLRNNSGLTPHAILSIEGMSTDVKAIYKCKIKFTNHKWKKY